MQCEIQRLRDEYDEDPNAKDAIYVLLDLADHQHAADELAEMYIEMQRGVINFPSYDDLIKE